MQLFEQFLHFARRSICFEHSVLSAAEELFAGSFFRRRFAVGDHFREFGYGENLGISVGDYRRMLNKWMVADVETDHGVGFCSAGGDAYENALALFIGAGDDEVQVRRPAEVFFVEEEKGVAGLHFEVSP